MADISSDFPIRTQLPGQVNYDDVVTKIGDGTTSTQLLAVNTDGSINIKQSTAANLNATVVQGTTPWVTKDQADGPVTPGTVASFSELIGGQYNSALPTLTTGQQSAVQLDSSGRLIVSTVTNDDHNYGVVGATTLRSAAQIGNATGAADFNYGTVGAQTLRTASEIGNSTGAADFNNGNTGAQTLRVAANLAVSGANVSSTNPVPVTMTSALIGTSVNNYNTATAIAVNGTSNHIYTITTGKTFNGKKIWASCSGAMKIEVRVSPDGSTYSSLWVGFNSTANPNISIDLDELVFLESGTGSTIEIIRTNVDKKALDVYSTISGQEV